MTPQRVQLSRKKGWRLPPNTVVVSRPTKWGNPFRDSDFRNLVVGKETNAEIAQRCVAAFVSWLNPLTSRDGWDTEKTEARRERLVESLHELRGKNLACWCKIGEPCHADFLLELANKGTA